MRFVHAGEVEPQVHDIRAVEGEHVVEAGPDVRPRQPRPGGEIAKVVVLHLHVAGAPHVEEHAIPIAHVVIQPTQFVVVVVGGRRSVAKVIKAV